MMGHEIGHQIAVLSLNQALEIGLAQNAVVAPATRPAKTRYPVRYKNVWWRHTFTPRVWFAFKVWEITLVDITSQIMREKDTALVGATRVGVERV